MPLDHSKRLSNASDAIAWNSCRRRAWFDLQETASGLAPDPFDQLIMQAGVEHERTVLESLGEHQIARGEVHTIELMKAQTPIIYQPKFIDDELYVVAQPDFLFLESEGYRAADAKLARSMRDKPELRIQLGVYQRVLRTDLATQALLGSGAVELIGDKDLVRADEYLEDMRELSHSERPAAHFGATRCKACPYRQTCVPEFEAEGNLGLNYFVDVRAIPHLEQAGFFSLKDLQGQAPEDLPDAPYFKGEKKSKAILHADALLENRLIVLKKPQPIPGTPIHFDIETNPIAADGGEEVYLWGFLLPPYKESDFEFVWHDGGKTADEIAWYEFLNRVSGYRDRYADVVFVHYARFERDVIKRYAKAFGCEEHPTVHWLLNEDGLFDLLYMVKESIVAPTNGYGLKEICKHDELVNFQWELEESGSRWSVVRFHDFLNSETKSERDAIKSDILSYNRDDVRATRALESWLDSFNADS